jgi:hypothetical protein
MTGEMQRSIMLLTLTAMAIALLVALFSESAVAQCVMCRASIGSNSVFARHLNIGTFVLLVPPVLIFCTIFFLAFRHRKSV